MGKAAASEGSQKKHDPFGIFDQLDGLFAEIGFDFANTFDFGEMSLPSGVSSPRAPGTPMTPPSPQARGETGTNDQTAAKPEAAPTHSSTQSSTLGRRALDVARTEEARGVKEEPPGSDDGPRVRQYQRGKGGNYWCAHFVSWCVNQAGSSPFGHTGSVSRLRTWGQNNGRYTPVAQAHPMPGDIFTKQRRDKQGRVVGGHTGFVLDYDPKSRRMRTVEGNSKDRVRIGSQSMSAIDGVIRL